MILPDFKVEQWMNIHENDAIYNLTDTCIQSLTMQDLLNFESINFNSLVLNYGAITGDVLLKQEILKLYKSGTIDNITTAQGCLQANELVMHTLLQADDEVIVTVPGYQQFYDVPASLGCKVHFIQLNEHRQWLPDIDDFRQVISARTKMIILNNPSNPTGCELGIEFLKELIALCQPYHTYILCDEVYRGLNSNEISMSDLYTYGISTSSLSKVYALAGLRLGWIKADKSVIDLINVRRDYSMISTGPLVDTLGTIALKHKDEILERSKIIVQTNKETLLAWLNDNPHFSVVIPEGGTVSFMKYDFDIASEQLALQLLQDKGIFFVPGSCFDFENHMRLGLGQDCTMFAQGLNQLSQWVSENIES